MKPLIPILVVATTSLAVASVQFARQASSERERADNEVTLRQQQAARVTELEKTQARLEREINTLRAAADAGPPLTAGIPAPRPAPPPRTEAREGAVFGAFSSDPNAPANPFSMARRGPGFMESDAGRKYMQTRMKVSMRRMHEDVGSALGLSDEKANKLLDLLADQQTRMSERFRGRDDAQVVDPRQVMQEAQAKNKAEIAALIGQDKMDEWDAYQKSLPDRSQVSMVNQQLTEAGVSSLSEDQRSELLTAFSEERTNLPRPEYNSSLPPEEQFAQSSQWQSDYDKAVLARAKSILSSEQYRAYKEFADFQSEMRKSLPARIGAPGAVMRVNAAPMMLEAGAAAPVIGTSVNIVAPAPVERQ
jgi:hypothetical protein